MGHFGEGSHVVKVTAFKNDVRERDQRRIAVHRLLESAEIGGEVTVVRADAKDLMPAAQ